MSNKDPGSIVDLILDSAIQAFGIFGAKAEDFVKYHKAQAVSGPQQSTGNAIKEYEDEWRNELSNYRDPYRSSDPYRRDTTRYSDTFRSSSTPPPSNSSSARPPIDVPALPAKSSGDGRSNSDTKASDFDFGPELAGKVTHINSPPPSSFMGESRRSTSW